ncbi:MAG TPA: cytochrome c biogenesis protein ResB [Opitutaceae bacterium]|nr:cytochrome c biogenesis protein ResB [Opitutaceae bacterium]
MNRFLRTTVGFLTSLRLTVALLILSILLVFAATLDQVHLGVWGVQAKYFHSFVVMTKVPGTAVQLPVFPGGYLLGLLLLANLIAAHTCRFRFTWRKSGIWLTHLGLIVLLAGEGLSGLLQHDNQMRIDVGQTRRYTESVRETELAVVDVTDPSYDQVVAVPVSLLQARGAIQHPKLPFTLKPVAYLANSSLVPLAQAPNPPAAATLGFGTLEAALPAPLTYKEDEGNWPSAYVELAGPEGAIGTFLVSTMLVEPQEFSYGNRTWRISLRAARDYLPFAITLLKFTHQLYPGSDIPKDFASTIRLKSDDGADDRQVRIFMNNPLRYGGRAFYQAGYANNDHTAVLQVVSNPGWRLPYLACGLMALGLAVQFGIHLAGFLRRRVSVPAGARPVSAPVAALP